MNKLPWFKFYPKDWMTDSGLRLCCWDTKGVYIDLLCIMAESGRYGYLEINGKSASHEMLMKRLSIHHKTLKKCLRELQDHGILSLDNGVLYSRKMVNQFSQHSKQKEFGKKGGNPTLNPTLKSEVNSNLKIELDKELDTDTEEERVVSFEACAKSAKPPKPSRKISVCDSEWMRLLKSNPAYSHLNIESEFGKASAWTSERKRHCTRQFFLNWLNRIPAPMNILFESQEKPSIKTFSDNANLEFEAKIDALYDIFISAQREGVFDVDFLILEIPEKVPDYFDKEIFAHIESHWEPSWIEMFKHIKGIAYAKRLDRLSKLGKKHGIQTKIESRTAEV